MSQFTGTTKCSRRRTGSPRAGAVASQNQPAFNQRCEARAAEYYLSPFASGELKSRNRLGPGVVGRMRLSRFGPTESLDRAKLRTSGDFRERRRGGPLLNPGPPFRKL